MKEKISIILASILSISILFICSLASAAPPSIPKPLSMYKDNYFILGNERSQIKGQFSAKYKLFSTMEVEKFYPFNGSIYFSYTHTFLWANYEKSKPIKETHYNPEFFIRSHHPTNYIQLGLLEHKSNGKDGLESRGWNRSYIQGNYEFNFNRKVNIGLNLKLFWLYAVSGGCSENEKFERKDISEYIGFSETKVYYYYKNSSDIEIFRLYIKGGLGASETFKYRKHRRFGFIKKGWLEAGAMIRIPKSHLFLYGQCYYGYSEWLQWYETKSACIRVGVLLKR